MAKHLKIFVNDAVMHKGLCDISEIDKTMKVFMSSLSKARRVDIDFLKGISIIAVVLYHMGLLESGYLGVDVFFVIAGFLTVPRVFKEICDKSYSELLDIEKLLY